MTEMPSGTPFVYGVDRNIPFLDGGLINREGDYFFGLKGCWIIGGNAVRFVCYELGIQHPRRFAGMSKIVTHQKLTDQIKDQIRAESTALTPLLRRLETIELSLADFK